MLTERHGDNPWASARQRPAWLAGACAEWCRWSVGGDRGGGPWRQVGPRLGSQLRYDGAQQPGPDHRRPKEGMEHRRLPPVEQPELPGCLPGALPPPNCEVLSSARCKWSPPPPTTLRRCHSTEKHWPQAPVIQVRWCYKGPGEQPAYGGCWDPQRETKQPVCCLQHWVPLVLWAKGHTTVQRRPDRQCERPYTWQRAANMR